MKIKCSIRIKTVCAILILAFVISIATISISYHVYATTMDEHYKNLAENAADTIAAVVDKKSVQKYTETVKNIYLKNPAPEFKTSQEQEAYYAQFHISEEADFQTLKKMMLEIKKYNDVLFTYIGFFDMDSKTSIYVLDADDTDTQCLPGTWDILYDTNYERLKSSPGASLPAYITDTESYGWLCSTGSPILDESGQVIAYAMVDISMEKVMQDRYHYLLILCSILIIIVILLIAAASWIINRAVIEPINKLAKATTYYGTEHKNDFDGNTESYLQQLDIHTGDEIENLYMMFRQMELDINDYIRNLTEITAEKERIGAELSIATQIQANMLPCIFPPFPDHSEFEIYASMKPAKEVGGDFYDFFMLDDKHLAVVMADVSGKGVPAALFMVIGKTLIKDHTKYGADLGDVFTEVNNLLCEGNKEGLFITAFEGVLDLETGVMEYVNAGHEMPYIFRPQEGFEALKVRHGFVLAGMEDIKYKSGSIQLNSGDIFFQYTDGVTEATNAQNELYGMSRLKNVLNKNVEESCQNIIAAVHDDINLFIKEAPQFDDITMLCLKYHASLHKS